MPKILNQNLSFQLFKLKEIFSLKKVIFNITESIQHQSMDLVISVVAFVSSNCLQFTLVLNGTRSRFSHQKFYSFFFAVTPKISEIAWFLLEHMFLHFLTQWFNYIKIKTVLTSFLKVEHLHS